MTDSTILYYTSNREDPMFEEKTIVILLKNCPVDMPIISISQKPMDLGKNICVGDVGASGFNMFRQILIGCLEATTKFVISAEADCLYPPDYFTYVPEREDMCYRNSNLWIVGRHRDYFWHKWNDERNDGGSTTSQVVARKFYIQILEHMFRKAPQWCVEEKNFPKERTNCSDVFDKTNILYFKTKNPVISVKTANGMRHYSPTARIRVDELPYWGSGKKLKKEYIENH